MIAVGLVAGVLLWFGVFLLIDRPAIPAHTQRDVWRTVSVVLFVLLMMVASKALEHWGELRALIAGCHY